jgi:hypothetical protein
MPPKKSPPSTPVKIALVSEGAGVTAGLEIWRFGVQFLLFDRSPDGRFTADVMCWNSAVGLNMKHTKLFKNATKDKDAA